MEYFNLLHSHKTVFVVVVVVAVSFFVIAAQISFLALSFPFLPALLLPVPSAFHTLSGCCKKFGVNYGPNLKMEP